MCLLSANRLQYNNSMIKICNYPECTHASRFLMSWNNKNGKHFGLVCSTHDKELGRSNLVKVGMPLEEAVAFEHYLAQTVNDANPLDWPEWFKLQYCRVPTPLTPKRTLPSGVKEQSVTSLNLSPGIQNTLRRNDIVTVNQLASISDHELLKIRQLGKVSLSEIRKCLKEYRDG